MCYNVYNVVLNVILDSSYMHIMVYIVLWQWETLLPEPIEEPVIKYMMYIHQHWTLFDHSLYWKGHIISAWTKRLLSLTSCCCHAPKFSPISWMVFASFCISWFLNLHNKSLKRGAVFPSLSLQCTFLSWIFVQCCAFERWVLCTVSPLLHFSLVPTFVKKKKRQCSIIGCRISSISCLTSLDQGQICLILFDQYRVPISFGLNTQL